jgi:hypothetical protein
MRKQLKKVKKTKKTGLVNKIDLFIERMGRNLTLNRNLMMKNIKRINQGRRRSMNRESQEKKELMIVLIMNICPMTGNTNMRRSL